MLRLGWKTTTAPILIFLMWNIPSPLINLSRRCSRYKSIIWFKASQIFFSISGPVDHHQPRRPLFIMGIWWSHGVRGRSKNRYYGLFFIIFNWCQLLDWFSFHQFFQEINNFIMSAIGNKADPSHPPLPIIKITASPRSPQAPRLSREPRIARTNSQSKPPKRTSTEKSFRALQIEKELKFSRNQP